MQYRVIEDLIDAGHDLRLDHAYPDFYREQQGSNARLPVPLDTQTLFNQLAQRILEQSQNRQRNAMPGDVDAEAGVQQLFNLVQGAFHANVVSLLTSNTGSALT